MMRGTSVRDRANQYEQSWHQAASPSNRLQTPTRQVYRSTSPTPNHGRRDEPYVASAHAGPSFPMTAAMYGSDYDSPSYGRTPPQRLPGAPGQGHGPSSAKKMIAKWEGGSSSLGGPEAFLAPNGTLQPPRGNTPQQPSRGNSPLSTQQMNRDYLNHKPLPTPNTFTPPYASGSGTTTPQYTPPQPKHGNSPLRNVWGPTSPTPQYPVSPIRGPPPISPARGAQMQPSPSRVSFAPSPNKHLQTPGRGRSGSVDGPANSWSTSPSEKKRKGNGKSPLKEMLSALGKRAKGKGKEKRESSYGSGGYDITMAGGLERVGSNGLPGGIVFRDRMGDQEMDPMTTDEGDDSIVRFSPCLFLVNMPGSTDHASGSWLTSWALLTATSLRITFCPIFQDPYSQGSPRRMLDPHTSIPFQMIPAPDPSQKWDFELDMADCVEVRSLRREEIGGRNVPVPPDGVGTEVLEMVCSDGKKQYIGVEGVGGRISWISAIWDVLLACKPEGQPLIPPPSPTKSSHHQVQQQRDVFGGSPGSNQRPIDEPSPFRPYSDHVPKQSSPLRPFERRESDEGPVGHGALPPVQKIGDRWVASSGVGVGASDLSEDPPPSRHLPDPLKTAVKQMFESPPPNEVGSGTGNERKQLYMATATGIQEYDDESDGGDQTIIPPRIRSPSINGAPIRFDSAATIGVGNKQSRDATERILAWQPATERELSIFARSPSRASARSNSRRRVLGETDRENSFQTAESGATDVSFDPSDLNPSRSASQTGRHRETPRRRGSKVATGLPPVDENTPPARHIQVDSGFSPMAEKAFRRMSRGSLTDENQGPRTPTRTPRELKSPRANEQALSPLAERAYRQLAGKSIDDGPTSPRSSREMDYGPRRNRDNRHSGLPKSVEMFSAESHSSETAENTTVRTPHTEHHMDPMIATRSRDLHADMSMPDHSPEEEGRGSGGALSKLLPAYSDLSHSEVGANGKLDEKQKSSLDPTTRAVSIASRDLQKVIGALTTLVGASKAMEDPTTLPRGLDERLNTIQLDVKAIENALNLSVLQLPSVLMQAKKDDTQPPDTMPEVHAKLDAIQRMCEDVLARHDDLVKSSESNNSVKSQPANNGRNGKQLGLGLSLNDDEKTAGDEVAQIMADLTGGSTNGVSPRRVGLQVLHNISAPASPHVGTDAGSVLGQEPLSEDVKKQIVEVLALVKELKEARTLQTQQTTDIARYLNELNTWLEKFVQNSAVELSSMSNRLDTLVGSKDDANDPNAPSKTSLPDLVSEIHNMLADQRKRNEEEGPVGQRLDGLLTMMGQERERQAGQQGMVEEVLTILARQRNDNEMLLRALANDLTSEIRGERIRFVEAMQQATTMNVTRHVEEFKKTLSAEVQKSIKELTRVKEEKRALESQIADLFALKAKFGGNSRRGSVEPSAAGQVNIIQAMAAAANPYNGGMGMAGMPAMAGQGGRVLPAPPG